MAARLGLGVACRAQPAAALAGLRPWAARGHVGGASAAVGAQALPGTCRVLPRKTASLSSSASSSASASVGGAAAPPCAVLEAALTKALPRNGPVVVRLSSTDVYANLALEEWLGGNEVFAHRKALMLWRNTACVVIGRNQNAWHECDLAELAARGIRQARRASGGGTVFHDLGNINLTFFTARDAFSKEANSALIADALNSHVFDGGGGDGGGDDDASVAGGGPSLLVEMNDRKDLVVGGRKVSGSAYRLNRTTAYHHCTLLVSTNLDALKGALRPTLPGIVTKGIASVRSPVCNLADVPPGSWRNPLGVMDAVERAYLDAHGVPSGTGSSVSLSASDLADASPVLGARRSELQTWEWTRGVGPQFTVDLPLPLSGGRAARARLEVKRGLVVGASLVDDGAEGSESEGVASALTAALSGTPFCRRRMLAALELPGSAAAAGLPGGLLGAAVREALAPVP